MEEIKNNGINNPKGPTAEPEIYSKHWFCSTVSATGITYTKDAESPAEFQGALKDAAIAWVDFLTDDFEKHAIDAAVQLGFSKELINPLVTNKHETYRDLETEMGIKLASVQVRELEVTIHPLIILLNKRFVLTLHPRSVDRRFARLRRYADTFLKKIPVTAPPEDRLTMLLLRLTDESNERNFEHLRQVEEIGDALNKDMMNPATPREQLGPKIYEMKRALITYLNALWQTVDVFHALRYGDAELITDDTKLLQRMGMQGDDVNRQIALAEHMSEVLASGLEVMQSIFNNQLQALNNRLARVMTYLTVLGTAVLVPNTLATIFSNSAFNMQPSDLWWYVTLLVASTIISTGLAWLWVRKMGWTRKMDTSVKDFGIDETTEHKKRSLTFKRK